MDGLTSLAVASARDVPGQALAAPLATLVDRYRQVFAPPARSSATLDRLLAPIAGAARVPVVAQHGDPGSWNLLLGPDGRIVVLDWESFEPDGPPLWDLWHLIASTTRDLDRSPVPRRQATRLVRTFLGTGEANDQVVRATARYRRAIAVETILVIPLMVFGWLHRALKESTRMPIASAPDAMRISSRRCWRTRRRPDCAAIVATGPAPDRTALGSVGGIRCIGCDDGIGRREVRHARPAARATR